MVGEPLYTVFYGKPDSLAMGLFVFCSFTVYYFRIVHGFVSNASSHVPQTARPFSILSMVPLPSWSYNCQPLLSFTVMDL